ncbi:hypothetical protein [Paenibacillus sanguinis]|uniref:hypothetical protein n=1 Tax=Paenibacillus sanguinis TaxID=225906 RepID=UPI0003622B89|nr:hypothetical protein [Paenibacillus sanguinis]
MYVDACYFANTGLSHHHQQNEHNKGFSRRFSLYRETIIFIDGPIVVHTEGLKEQIETSRRVNAGLIRAFK